MVLKIQSKKKGSNVKVRQINFVRLHHPASLGWAGRTMCVSGACSCCGKVLEDFEKIC